LAGAVAHVVFPETKVDSITVALLVVALLPWLGGVLDSVELPWGGKVQFRRLEERLTKAERRTAEASIEANDASRTAQAAIGAASNAESSDKRTDAVPYERLVEVASRYVPMRAMPSGSKRAESLNRLFGTLIGMVPRVEFDVARALWDDEPGIRLAAYARLYAIPDPQLFDQLVAALTEREDLPFSQYWAIRTVALLLENSAVVTPDVIDRLHDFRDRLPDTTDRRNELDRILTTIGA
jgi:hypothetical protein